MNQYSAKEIEKKWQSKWRDNKTFVVKEDKTKEKFYVLDMFPYPSGEGLHVGHPLGYIASDIVARYKKHRGFNVLHPMGYDSFGLPAEQYAIQTGQHPEITTEKNIKRYRQQLNRLGFCFDWERELRTSDPEFYKWTQWMFKKLFNSWYDTSLNKARKIADLVLLFEKSGTEKIEASQTRKIKFTKQDWESYTENKKSDVLMNFRIAYLSESMVNWCPELGTVLANDEVKEGFSERGGYPVIQKSMMQWSLRISAYSQRLLDGLDKVDFSSSLKEQQKNWIGKSEGALITFDIENKKEKIKVFTTRADTIFGVSFLTLAPELKVIEKIVTEDKKREVLSYIKQTSNKTERERQLNQNESSGVFTGAFAIHPLSNKKLPIWISEYVLSGYGTGAVMAVPAGDQRDYDFAKKYQLEIPNIFKNIDISKKAHTEKDIFFMNSSFLDNCNHLEATEKALKKLTKNKCAEKKINYRLRDAIFSRQRYWGEPFPVFYQNNLPYLIDGDGPVTLPEIDKYLPTESGDPPLARAKKSDWNIFQGDKMDTNIMPGWAGSSWYFLRFMDAKNDNEFVSKEKADYWGQVDLYIGGAEHAVGHLLYSRFWTKFLYDKELISFDEPFKKLINQGMILGRSNFVYRVKDSNTFVTKSLKNNYETSKLYVDINLVDNDLLNIEKFKNWRKEFLDADFILNDDGKYECHFEIEKMSKSKYNTQTPDDLVESYGADTLRMYEMFLGPLEQFKPWDINGISGVHNFLRKLWRHLHDEKNIFHVNHDTASENSLKTIHKTIKKVEEDIERFSFNTVVSSLMICLNELIEQKCVDKKIITDFIVLLSPYAPHFSEEIWQKLGNTSSISQAQFPKYESKFLVESEISYPVSFNGKMRFKVSLPAEMNKEDIETFILKQEKTIHYLESRKPKRIIIVPRKIINIVI